jgi:NAD(P) transhydrogenase subunit alpha
VVKHNVTIVGETNLPALVAADASRCMRATCIDFLKLCIDKEGKFYVPMDDDIVAACLMTQNGEVLRK